MALKFPKIDKQVMRTENKQGGSPHQHDIKQYGARSSSVAPLLNSIGNLDAADDNEGYKSDNELSDKYMTSNTKLKAYAVIFYFYTCSISRLHAISEVIRTITDPHTGLNCFYNTLFSPL